LDLSTLNPVQRQAVETTDGAVLILAGAGSGKTRVLTHRVAWMVSQGITRPWNILALTFTNKAAKEMKSRIQHLVGESVSDIWVGTFHSIFARILRQEADFIGYARNYTIYDSDDQLKLVKQCMDNLQISTNQINPRRIRTAISTAKNSMLDPDQFLAFDSGFVHEQIAEVYREYERRLREANSMDFDDLLLKPIELFKNHPERLAAYQHRFSHILIDEYQDTNKAQYEVSRMLAQTHGNLCVVGDDDQSIYGWRGADISNILDFEEHWSKAKVFKLEQNYRSTQIILEAAHSIVSHNESRKEKKLWTDNGRGDKISLLVGEDDKMEAAQISQNILEHVEKKGEFKDFAVLYRTNSQSRVIEDAFRRNNIRYQIVGGVRFYERREVKDLLAYLHFIANPKDTVALHRIVNYPRRGIGTASLKSLQAHAHVNRISVIDAIIISGSVPGVSRGASVKMMAFAEMIELYRLRMVDESPADVVDDLVNEIKLMETLEAEGPEGIPRMENVRELQDALTDYCENSELGLEGFLQEVALVADVDKWEDQEDQVTMMTVHSAKGLEFNQVFVTGLEDGLFPLAGVFDDTESMEEERRLFYVAATRARRKLFLTYANFRRRFGRTGGGLPSSFLELIPREILHSDAHLAASIFSKEETDFHDRVQRIRQDIGNRNRKQGYADNAGGTPQQSEAARQLAANPLPVVPQGQQSRGKFKSQTDAMMNKYSPFRSAGKQPAVDLSDSQEAEISDPADIYVSATVLHHKYGQGTVIHTVGFGGDMRVSVRFNSVGVKKMVARLAKLRVLG
jgi:DNA helicase II / ATP-dependent DNA helicase PcrA